MFSLSESIQACLHLWVIKNLLALPIHPIIVLEWDKGLKRKMHAHLLAFFFCCATT
jgi:hypothetical protein